ncbi:MAG TPA: helix-turn-helix domain-containing protein [Desulfurococcales archaeon]|nr:helix-turn-helix domain-containing protein [Desulfurococcales archaeon]
MVTKYIIENIAKRIAGDIVWSSNPGATLKKWREIFGVSQVELSKVMGVTPSVISDYENNRRTPGSRFIKRFIDALLRIDRNRGWVTTRDLTKSMKMYVDIIIDIYEYQRPIPLSELLPLIDGELLTSSDFGKLVYGYTVLDSIKAILHLSGNDFYVMMGQTSERALIFTKVTTGRSPMVAVKVSPIKPAVVIIHGPKSCNQVDSLAIKLAESERLPLVLSLIDDINTLIRRLRSID